MSLCSWILPTCRRCCRQESRLSTRLARRSLIAQLVGATSMLVLGGCRAVPQVVDDEAVFKELDALYTAVTSQRRNLVDDCRVRLSKLHEEGRLSDTGFAVAAKIITETEQNQWTDAAQHLYDFMRASARPGSPREQHTGRDSPSSLLVSAAAE